MRATKSAKRQILIVWTYYPCVLRQYAKLVGSPHVSLSPAFEFQSAFQTNITFLNFFQGGRVRCNIRFMGNHILFTMATCWIAWSCARKEIWSIPRIGRTLFWPEIWILVCDAATNACSNCNRHSLHGHRRKIIDEICGAAWSQCWKR